MTMVTGEISFWVSGYAADHELAWLITEVINEKS